MATRTERQGRLGLRILKAMKAQACVIITARSKPGEPGRVSQVQTCTAYVDEKDLDEVHTRMLLDAIVAKFPPGSSTCELASGDLVTIERPEQDDD